ncbi:hypothetical protein QUC31_001282 [Theobroma cacao]
MFWRKQKKKIFFLAFPMFWQKFKIFLKNTFHDFPNILTKINSVFRKLFSKLSQCFNENQEIFKEKFS